MMNASGIHKGVLIATSVVLSSCASVYHPSTVPTPQVSERNDVSVTGTVGTSGGDINAAFAPTDHWGVFAHYNTIVGRMESNGNKVIRERNNFLGGLGYLEKINQNILFEAYGGYGRGKGEAEYGGFHKKDFVDADNERLILSGSFNQFFLISGITKRRGDTWKISFHTRVVHGIYDRHEAFVMQRSDDSRERLEQSDEHFPAKSFTTVDPVITLHAGSDPVFFYMQTGWSVRMSYMHGEYNPLIFSLGISIQPGLGSSK